MAEYDGSIRIKTEIEVKTAEKNLASLESRMGKAANKISSLKKEMNALEQEKTPTEAYKDMQKELETAYAALDSLVEKQNELKDMGFEAIPASLEEELNQAGLKAGEIEEKIEQLVQEGKAFTLGSDTEKYQKLSQQLSEQENAYEVMNQQRDIAVQKIDTAKQKLEAEKAEEEHLAEIKNNAVVSNQRIVDVLERRKQLLSEIKDLEAAGVTSGYQDYDSKQRELAALEQEIKEYSNSIDQAKDSYSRLGNVAKRAIEAIGNFLKSAASGIANFGKTLKNIAQKIFPSFNSSARKSNSIFNSGFKNILKYGLGIRSLYVLFNKLQSAISEGFTNLYNDNKKFKSSVDSLKASFTTLKNSLAAAFSPLVTVAIPYIQKVIDFVNSLLNSIGQFVAAITGQKTYTKAITQTTAAIEDETKAGNKQLSGLDKLNNLSSQQSSGTGTGGTAFEEVPISDQWKDIAQWFKDMWANSDFYELGELLGEKLKNALDSIPWEEIQKTASKLGKSLASLINGSIEVEGLGYSIGQTLAEAFHTGFEFLNAFVHELHWDSLGKFIAESLNGIFQNIDWNLIYDTFVTGAGGVGDAINAFVDNIDRNSISTTISNFINTFINTIYTLITTVDWLEIGTKVGETVSNALIAVEWSRAGETIGSALRGAIQAAFGLIENIDFDQLSAKIKTAAQTFLDEMNAIDPRTGLNGWQELGTTLADCANGIVQAFESIPWDEVAKGVGETISTFLSNADIEVDLILGALAINGISKIVFGKGILSVISSKLGTSILSSLGKFSWSSLGTYITEALTSLGTAISTFCTTDIMAASAGQIGIAILSGLFIGGEIGKLIDNHVIGPLIDALGGDEVMAELYKNFSWFGEGGFFDEMWCESDTFLGNVQTWVDALGMMFSDAWESIKSGVSSAWENIKSGLSTAWDNIKSTASTKWTNIKDTVSNTWSDVKQGVSTTAEAVKIGLSTAWDNIKSNASTAWTELKDTVVNIFCGIWTGIKGAINSILGGIEGMANGVVKGINVVIGALNNLSFTTPDWLPGGMGGKEFGFNIKKLGEVSLPRLATGTVVPPNKEFAAILGDNKTETEIVSPLSTMKQALKEALAETGMSGANSDSGDIIIQIEGREVFRIVKKQAQEYKKQTGRPAFQ